jgi:hypothetical protein
MDQRWSQRLPSTQPDQERHCPLRRQSRRATQQSLQVQPEFQLHASRYAPTAATLNIRGNPDRVTRLAASSRRWAGSCTKRQTSKAVGCASQRIDGMALLVLPVEPDAGARPAARVDARLQPHMAGDVEIQVHSIVLGPRSGCDPDAHPVVDCPGRADESAA